MIIVLLTIHVMVYCLMLKRFKEHLHLLLIILSSPWVPPPRYHGDTIRLANSSNQDEYKGCKRVLFSNPMYMSINQCHSKSPRHGRIQEFSKGGVLFYNLWRRELCIKKIKLPKIGGGGGGEAYPLNPLLY